MTKRKRKPIDHVKRLKTASELRRVHYFNPWEALWLAGPVVWLFLFLVSGIVGLWVYQFFYDFWNNNLFKF